MYIKGISKVLIVITVLLSFFLVTPKRVDAAEFDAQVVCPKDYKLTSGDAVSDVCCPTTSYFSKLIIASNPSVIESVKIKGGISITIPFPGNLDCRATYDRTNKDHTSIANQTYDVDSLPAELDCAVNYCKVVRTSLFKTEIKCLTQLSVAYKDTDIVCCVTKKGQKGQVISKNSCVPDMTVGITVFNQAPVAITPEEICKKDAGFKNKDGNWINDTSDTRPESEKNLIFKDCDDCLKNPKNLWTGVGCMEASINGLITTIIRIFYGIITAIMLLKIIIAGYKYYGGDPEQLKDSKAEIFSAIGAAFALTLGIIALRYIGIDILGLGEIDGISSGLPILK